MSSYDCPELPIETLSCRVPNCWDPLPPAPPIPPDALAANEDDVDEPIMLYAKIRNRYSLTVTKYFLIPVGINN